MKKVLGLFILFGIVGCSSGNIDNGIPANVDNATRASMEKIREAEDKAMDFNLNTEQKNINDNNNASIEDNKAPETSTDTE